MMPPSSIAAHVMPRRKVGTMPDAIPATNTSSISITKISAPAVLQGESPMVGLSEKSGAHAGTL